MANTRLTIIIPAADQEQETAWVKANVDRAAGEFTFTSSYTATGTDITHYVASGRWSDAQVALLTEHFGESAYVGNPQQVIEVLG